MRSSILENEYFEWIKDLVCSNRVPDYISYQKLLVCLHNIEFRYSVWMDENRASDGVDLRYTFAINSGYGDTYEDVLDILAGPCSVLEMITALAVRMENVMDDALMGDRTRQWFWRMIVNLGLGDMTDDRFDKSYVEDVIERFLDREYEPNGKGGLFIIRNSDVDLRDIEIWHQACRYLNTVT